MNRQHWARIATLPVALLLATTGCGGNAPAATKKRLGDQRPCELAKLEDLEKVFGRVDTDPAPHQEGPQCYYWFENGNLTVSRAAEGARPGTSFDLDGAAAKRVEQDKVCVIDVWLVPDDINQQFGIAGELNGDASCDINIRVARLIMSGLPG